MNWNKYPFVRMVSALALGILVSDRVGMDGFVQGLPYPWGKGLLIGVLVLLLALLVLLHRTLKAYRHRWIFGIVVLVAFGWLGFVRMALFQQNMEVQKLAPKEEGWQMARVLEPPEVREKTVKVMLELSNGKAMAYFQKDGEALKLCYGDLVGISTSLEEVSPPKNPMEFDYKSTWSEEGCAGASI